jgi:hypothetical protein
MPNRRRVRGSQGILEATKFDESTSILSADDFEQWSDVRLVFDYLGRLAPDQRREALAQEGVLGDRLRQAWAEYLTWYEKNRKCLESEQARLQRRRDRRAAGRT